MKSTRYNRRDFLKTIGQYSLGACGTAGLLSAVSSCSSISKSRKPNIIFILADDLGYGDLGCYGQKKIKTPNIDHLAAEGIRFTNHYAGSTVCAPSRCALMTGLHTGHSPVRGNYRDAKIGVATIPREIPNVAEILKTDTDYVTGLCGRWHLGGEKSQQQPSQRGFVHSFGKLSSIFEPKANSFFLNSLFKEDGTHVGYETYSRIGIEPLYENGKLYNLEEKFKNKPYLYIGDLVTDKALEFIRDHKNEPFFLYMPYTLVHSPIEVPDLGQYRDKDWPQLEKGFAAMVTYLDMLVGRVVNEVKKQGLDENTLIIFTSDNGPHKEEGHNPEFFESNGSLKGIKRDLYEGGIRMPMIARWPGKIKPGTETNHISAIWDFLPTACDIAGIKPPKNIDGISYLPTVLGKPQKKHQYLYWEFHERKTTEQAVRLGNWKAIRHKPTGPIELYDLKTDIGEENNLANQHREIVAKIETILKNIRTEHEIWKLKN